MSGRTIRTLITFGLVAALWVVFALTTQNFVSARNMFQLLKESAFIGLIACGMCFTIVSGSIDLSAGGIVTVAAIVCSRFSFTGAPGFVVVLIGILAGAVLGCFNAFYVTKLHLPAFVATLAAGYIYLGLSLILAFHNNNGNIVNKGITNASYLQIGRPVGNFYWITLVWIIVGAILFFIMETTNFGTHLYATGSNERSAEMSGVNKNRVKIISFIVCGACAGLAGTMQVAYQTSAVASLGKGYEFQAIAACVVGGCVLGGGKGDQIGAFLGSIFMVMILNGLNKYGLNSSWQYITEGLIIVIATAFDSFFNTIMTKRIEKRTMRRDMLKGEPPISGGVV